jgi:Asp-tRNA(Asn)/Glu-tRNA(Gln) amidotransferase A subunit family amidase
MRRPKRQARRLDNDAAARPLHNVPMTVKEAFDVGGLATICGFPFRRFATTSLNATRRTAS